ncbi:SAM-dependent methyltransferase [Microscilla marina ATCC 23134]|uniref:SAM-dependent methyltransferase n=2 Tax=Microscilla marina TaxID=1027 RepID=A1ZXE3_MICM2|nr:SAM-dependent methyltransferase [Microscilla marina ATCC 23134]
MLKHLELKPNKQGCKGNKITMTNKNKGMMKEFTQKDLASLANQLSCPSGTSGIEVGNKMHQTNISMTQKALEAAQILSNQVVLELGHGNAAHLEQILAKAQGVTYHGLDVSETMYEQAQKLNKEFVEVQKAKFSLYDGTNIPYDVATFDKIITVNTIYFWQQPAQLVRELYRVLKPQGSLSIAFAQKSSMESLPFTKYEFALYDTDTVTELLEKERFRVVNVVDQYEQINSKIEGLNERDFTVVTVQK